MAITAFVAVVGYTTLSTVISGVERGRDAAERIHAINRALSVLSRDIRQFANRPVRDEFGDVASALTGGTLARQPLTLTRAGWHNTIGAPRSSLQRVAYQLEDDALVRLNWPVLDPPGPMDPQAAELLTGVIGFRVRFLPAVEAVTGGRGVDIDRRLWSDSWIADVSQPGTLVDPPAALEITLELDDWGEVNRLYVLPPL